jgi:SAM-dependent methyltransferase
LPEQLDSKIYAPVGDVDIAVRRQGLDAALMTSQSGQPFAEAAPYYPFRAPYAPAAIDYLEQAFRIDRQSRVLDLGCGPGTLTLPISRSAGHVVAVDPCRAMIDEGRRRAAEAGITNIDWRRSRAEDLDVAEEGHFLLAIIGQAFHWMDRDAVLRKLARILEPRGALVLVNPGRRRPQESWEPTGFRNVHRT